MRPVKEKVIPNHIRRGQSTGVNEPAPSPKPNEAYHHGDLRSALIAAAREALELAAPENISLKSLAVRLGVSQPAPYRHFQDREALLTEVAIDGFVRFRQALVAAGEGKTELERFEQSALAYLDFARSNRGVYRLMFASSLLKVSEDQRLRQSSAASYQFLLEAVSHHTPRAQAQVVAVSVWSTLHGLAMLEAQGLSGGSSDAQVLSIDVVRHVIATVTGSKTNEPAGLADNQSQALS